MHVSPISAIHINEANLNNSHEGIYNTKDEVFALRELFFHIASMTTPYQYSQLICVNRQFRQWGREGFEAIHKIFSARIGLPIASHEAPSQSYHPQKYAKHLLNLFSLADPKKHLLYRNDKGYVKIYLKEISNYFSDSNEAFIIAKLCVQNAPGRTLIYLNKFILSEENYLELAKEAIARYPHNLTDHVNHEELSKEMSFTLVKFCAQIAPDGALYNILELPNLLSQEQRFEIAMLCAKTIPDKVLEEIDSFALSPDQIYELTKLCISQSVSNAFTKLSNSFSSFSESFNSFF